MEGRIKLALELESGPILAVVDGGKAWLIFKSSEVKEEIW